MKEQRIIEEMAKIYAESVDPHWWCPNCLREVSPQCVSFQETHDSEGCGVEVVWVDDKSDYPSDHDAVQRVIDGFKEGYGNSLDTYSSYLWSVMRFPFNKDVLLQATCAQKCEAILKALGKWEDS